ncbi:glycosyltransferase family 2 protein [Azohydromonas aeria]|uniref:glycosyltransferase family 2 protein n=1 Tax=Azohydromonas aeria TaxID=2590212 RepID=UPI0012FA7D40|nr:glycosyltransferase family 2 protein [Azohydromonas aeria]
MMTLGIVVPCYNEEEVIAETSRRLVRLLHRLQASCKISMSSFVCFVDDGSTDRTWKIIEQLAAQHAEIRGIKLARNSGHQNALMAGLLGVSADAVVSIDADLQDDENVIETMVDRCAEGFDLVLGVRSDRSTDTVFKRATASGHYRLLKMMGVEVVTHHADFRLMTRPVLEALRQFGEVNLYLRGIIPLLGFRTATVPYKRVARFAGTSKYPISKMVSLSLQGITSLSIQPIRLVAIAGMFISAISVLAGLWALIIRLFTSQALPGWASTVVPSYFLGGLQLLSLGVIGEYVGKIYMETKRRPRFVIEKTTACLDSRAAARHMADETVETLIS